VFADEVDLVGVARVVGDDRLDQPVVDRSEVVGRGIEVEGHDLGAPLRDGTLACRLLIVGAAEKYRDEQTRSSGY